MAPCGSTQQGFFFFTFGKSYVIASLALQLHAMSGTIPSDKWEHVATKRICQQGIARENYPSGTRIFFLYVPSSTGEGGSICHLVFNLRLSYTTPGCREKGCSHKLNAPLYTQLPAYGTLDPQQTIPAQPTPNVLVFYVQGFLFVQRNSQSWKQMLPSTCTLQKYEAKIQSGYTMMMQYIEILFTKAFLAGILQYRKEPERILLITKLLQDKIAMNNFLFILKKKLL